MGLRDLQEEVRHQAFFGILAGASQVGGRWCSKRKPAVSAPRERWSLTKGGGSGLAMRTTANIRHRNLEKYPRECFNMFFYCSNFHLRTIQITEQYLPFFVHFTNIYSMPHMGLNLH